MNNNEMGTTEATRKPPVEYMEDGKGRLVPKHLISDLDMARHELVMELMDKALQLQTEMMIWKHNTMNDVRAFCEMSAEKYDAPYGGRKGNISLVSFDGKAKVQVQNGESLQFDERLHVAKELIDKCLSEWAADSREEIKTIIHDAFQVDKEGRINVGRILSLRRLKIDHPTWLKAMLAISDSITVAGSKQYIRVYERDDPEGKWHPIALDMAAL